MSAFAQRQNSTQNLHSVSPAQRDHAKSRHAPVLNPYFTQQSAWGNQALQRMLRNRAIQAKLTVNTPGDKYEQEADRLAEEVMRMPEPRPQVAGGSEATAGANIKEKTPQPRSLSGQITPLVKRQAEEEEEAVEEPLQAKEIAGRTPERMPHVAAAIAAMKEGGAPLSASARDFFEPRFGHDFSQVRLHTGPQAATTARAVNARAFTVGHDIVFGGDNDAGSTEAGKRLLAHELTHVVQQTRPGLPDLQGPSRHAHAPGLAKGSSNLGDKPSSDAVRQPAVDDTRRKEGERLWDHGPMNMQIQCLGIEETISSITGFLGIDASEIAAQVTDPINAILTIKGLLALPLVGDTIRNAVADQLSGSVAEVLNLDDETLQKLHAVFANREAYFEQLREFLEPYAASLSEVAMAEAGARLAQLKTQGEPFARVIDAMGNQLAMFPSQWWPILKQILVDQFALWDWTTESKELEKLSKELGDNLIDTTEYAIGAVRTVLGGMDRLLGAIGLAAFLVGFVGGATTGAGLGGTGAGVVGGVATAGAGAAPSAAVGSGAGGTAGGGLGGGAGAGLFAILGTVSLVGTIAVEVAAVGKAVSELHTEDIPEAQEDRQYQQIAGSILTLAMMAAFALLGAIAGRFAKKMGARLMQAVGDRSVRVGKGAALQDPSLPAAPVAGEIQTPTRTPDRLPGFTPEEQRLLATTGDADVYPEALPKNLADQELAIVAKAEKTPILDTGDGYINEVDLGNGHAWKEHRDGTWCRFSNRRTNCTRHIDTPGAQRPGTIVATADSKKALQDLYFEWAKNRAADDVEISLAANVRTRTYAVVVGDVGRVVLPEGGEGWITIAHTHPGAQNQPGFMHPSLADMEWVIYGAGRDKLRIRKWIHSQTPEGHWREVEYGFDVESEKYYIQPTGDEPRYFDNLDDRAMRDSRIQNELGQLNLEERIRRLAELNPEETYTGWYARQYIWDL